jgi:hypothetical protein
MSLIIIAVIILALVIGPILGRDEVAEIQRANGHDGGIVSNVVSVLLLFLAVWYVAVEMAMPHRAFLGLSMVVFGLLNITKRVYRNSILRNSFPLSYLAPQFSLDYLYLLRMLKNHGATREAQIEFHEDAFGYGEASNQGNVVEGKFGRYVQMANWLGVLKYIIELLILVIGSTMVARHFRWSELYSAAIAAPAVLGWLAVAVLCVGVVVASVAFLYPNFVSQRKSLVGKAIGYLIWWLLLCAVLMAASFLVAHFF